MFIEVMHENTRTVSSHGDKTKSKKLNYHTLAAKLKRCMHGSWSSVGGPNSQYRRPLKYEVINNKKGGAIYPRMIRASWNVNNARTFFAFFIIPCGQKHAIYAIMQNHPRIKSIRRIQAR